MREKHERGGRGVRGGSGKMGGRGGVRSAEEYLGVSQGPPNHIKLLLGNV